MRLLRDLYGLSGSIGIGALFKILALDCGISLAFLVFGGALLQYAPAGPLHVVALALGAAGILLLPWALISVLIRVWPRPPIDAVPPPRPIPLLQNLYGVSAPIGRESVVVVLTVNLLTAFALLLAGIFLLVRVHAGPLAILAITLGLASAALVAWTIIALLLRFWRDPNAPHGSGIHLGGLQWAAILAVFTLVMLLKPGRIAEFFWVVYSPASFAAHMDDDETLANLAARDATLIGVLRARAEAGDRSAMYFYGALYDTGNPFCTPAIPRKSAAIAITWYQRAVALDDQGAERNLGIDYHEGAGVPRDDVQAVALLERAAAKNDDYAEYYLGIMLERGEGEPADIKRAAALEAAAAARGFAPAEVELGSLYFNGTGLPRDTQAALRYWNQAAAQNNQAAQQLLLANGPK